MTTYVDMLQNTWRDLLPDPDKMPVRMEGAPLTLDVLLWEIKQRWPSSERRTVGQSLASIPILENRSVPPDEVWIVYASGRKQVVKLTQPEGD